MKVAEKSDNNNHNQMKRKNQLVSSKGPDKKKRAACSLVANRPNTLNIQDVCRQVPLDTLAYQPSTADVA